jgi:hypothetical protein
MAVQTPTRSSQLYTKAIEVVLPARVNAIACPAGNGVCSSVVSKIFYNNKSGLNYSLYKGTWDKCPILMPLLQLIKGMFLILI